MTRPGSESLLPHLRATLSLTWEKTPAVTAPYFPVVDRYLHEVARRRPPARERALSAALALVRRWADGDSQPYCDWTRMVTLQEVILDKSPLAFREGSAHCHQRTYGNFAGLEDLFKRKIAHDTRDHAPAQAKALRLYMDLIHFHPFEDGNARAALLWMEYILRQARQSLPDLRVLTAMTELPINGHNYQRLLKAVLGSSREVSA